MAFLGPKKGQKWPKNHTFKDIKEPGPSASHRRGQNQLEIYVAISKKVFGEKNVKVLTILLKL